MAAIRTLEHLAQSEIISREVNRPLITLKKRRPRILLVTPELNGGRRIGGEGQPGPRAKAGGLADVCTLLVDSLSDMGADVHVAMPHFRHMFESRTQFSRKLHLSQDREFFYRRSVYEGSAESNRKAALVFQRDVIHHILPKVKPDIVHCHDWMTGLVPAAAKTMGIRSLFTIHNVHDEKATLAEIEDRGIDAAGFWQHLHYSHFPTCYDETRGSNPVNFMASAIHAADTVNTVSETFLREMTEGRHASAWGIVDVLRAKFAYGEAEGIINAPDDSWSPRQDDALARSYDSRSHAEGKAVNKRRLQQLCGLEEDPEAPVLFWPSRLDPVQKGCQLLSDILFKVVSDYMALGLQVVFVADGPFREHFDRIADVHGMRNRVGVMPFNDALSRLAFAGSDFVLMPSAYEPCGLAQMVGLKYGTLPIVHQTGGLKDTVTHLDVAKNLGNGFVFENHDCNGLRWAIDEAMRFFIRSAPDRDRQVRRIMDESERDFSSTKTLESYVKVYEKLAGRPLFA
ncbi:glycogen/starch synthase [Luteolibacter pohnpeiensis]|uniref:starch synthase n=1 Tax=Luteolibacter pohnpeiensis TaxID=454153 RepID=A0A934VTD0_9BACT|nr:glycogen/starch synthase [Luteolibacter pohnpeiensis]MBK1881362.1 glycogen/starch synthase [Luteolibacter pohnpeiensis]